MRKLRRARDRINVRTASPIEFDFSTCAAELAEIASAVPDKRAGEWKRERKRLQAFIRDIRRVLEKIPGSGMGAARLLTTLELALASLKSGECHPILKPDEVHNRPPSSAISDQVRRARLQCVWHLIAAGSTKAEAYRVVARELKARGHNVAASTVKGWDMDSRPGSQRDTAKPQDGQWLDHHVRNWSANVGFSAALANVRSWLDDPRLADISAMGA